MPPRILRSMYPLFAAWMILGLTWIVGRRIERATPDWTQPADLAPSIWGVALGLLNAAMTFMVLAGHTGGTAGLRFGLLLSIGLSCVPALWLTLNSTNPRVCALWKAFFTTLLVLSCLLALLSGTSIMQNG